jgi:hypothetical protein
MFGPGARPKQGWHGDAAPAASGDSGAAAPDAPGRAAAAGLYSVHPEPTRARLRRRCGACGGERAAAGARSSRRWWIAAITGLGSGRGARAGGGKRPPLLCRTLAPHPSLPTPHTAPLRPRHPAPVPSRSPPAATAPARPSAPTAPPIRIAFNSPAQAARHGLQAPVCRPVPGRVPGRPRGPLQVRPGGLPGPHAVRRGRERAYSARGARGDRPARAGRRAAGGDEDARGHTRPRVRQPPAPARPARPAPRRR